MINLSEVVLCPEFNQDINVTRGNTLLTFSGVIMPTGANDILLLPESERYLPSVKIYTPDSLERGDIVHHHGIDYVIKTIADWSDYGYYNQIGVRHLPTAKGHSGGFEIT